MSAVVVGCAATAVAVLVAVGALAGFAPQRDAAAQATVQEIATRQGYFETDVPDDVKGILPPEPERVETPGGVQDVAAVDPEPVRYEVSVPCPIMSDVELGSTGQDAACVEATLQLLGAQIEVDGTIDDADAEAIVQLQREQGRTPDGVVGPKTARSFGIEYQGGR